MDTVEVGFLLGFPYKMSDICCCICIDILLYFLTVTDLWLVISVICYLSIF